MTYDRYKYTRKMIMRGEPSLMYILLTKVAS